MNIREKGKNPNRYFSSDTATPTDQVLNSGQYFLSITLIGEYLPYMLTSLRFNCAITSTVTRLQ